MRRCGPAFLRSRAGSRRHSGTFVGDGSRPCRPVTPAWVRDVLGESSRLLLWWRPRPQRAAVSRLQRLKERTSPCPQLQLQSACSLQALKGDGRSQTWRKQGEIGSGFPGRRFKGLDFVLRRGFPPRWVRLHTTRQSFDPSIPGFPICPPPLSTSCLQAPPLSSTCVTVLSRSRDQANNILKGSTPA